MRDALYHILGGDPSTGETDYARFARLIEVGKSASYQLWLHSPIFRQKSGSCLAAPTDYLVVITREILPSHTSTINHRKNWEFATNASIMERNHTLHSKQPC